MISLTSLSNMNGQLTYALARPAHPLLVTILDKAINNITDEEIQEIVYKRTMAEGPETSLELMFYEQPSLFIGCLGGLCFTAVILSVLFFMLSQSKLRLANEIKFKDESYRIVNELSGEQIFLYDYKEQKLNLPEIFA